TAAGRSAAATLFAEALAQGKLQVAYAPLELPWAVHALIRRQRPRCAIMTEIDTWPVLLTSIRRAGVPLAMANAQYPRKSLENDLKWLGFRSHFFRAYELVLCKSETHAERFRRVGCARVVVAGETRFDLPVSPLQLDAAQRLKASGMLGAPQRPIVCFASAIVGEDEQFLQACTQVQAGLQAAGLDKPLFVYVPRSPQRFDTVDALFRAAGMQVARRSRCFDADLQATAPSSSLADTDVLLGDSLGEMYFYLALSQVVVVGASFVPMGAHNIIEPLALKKPVMVGHSIWGIEYPGVEALAAGVLQQHMDIASLSQALLQLLTEPDAYAQAMAGAQAFYAEHAGATRKHMAALTPWLAQCP
ncbi:3-deoxy-D-manno-octulosonic acid transferase, partial [Hydrogenophaga sp.]|uniref:3-deoxy-D-manno-octulosonic acid transferase n=1 Tax=Hydrogenophaga sp. TaxID=1904254 RepID=UPI0035637306